MSEFGGSQMLGQTCMEGTSTFLQFYDNNNNENINNLK